VSTWTDASQSGGDTSGAAIRAQAFNSDGSKLGAEFVLNPTTAGDQSQSVVTALTSGQFVAAWTDTSQSGGDTSGNAIRAQIFNLNGSKSGAEILLNTTTLRDQFNPAIAALANGDFVVAWTDNSQTGGDTSGTAIRAQLFNPDGSMAGGEFVVNTLTIGDQNQPAVTGLPDGRFVVGWGNC